MQPNRLLIGIGNEYRSDDGIGLLIAREIRKKNLPLLTIKEESGEGASLMEAWKGFHQVILVDAVSSGDIPGRIHTFDAAKEKIPVKYFHYSTHAFSIAEAIELARTLDVLPKHLIVYGIEGKNFSAGMTISKNVEKAVPHVIKQIVDDFDTSR